MTTDNSTIKTNNFKHYSAQHNINDVNNKKKKQSIIKRDTFDFDLGNFPWDNKCAVGLTVSVWEAERIQPNLNGDYVPTLALRRKVL